MLLNTVKTLVVFVSVMSYGCVAVPIIYAIGAADRAEMDANAEARLKPFVGFVKVEIDKSVTASTLRGAKVSTVVLGNDIKTTKNVPSQREKELSNTAMKEILHSFSISGVMVNVLASDILHIEVLYAEELELTRDLYIFNFRGGRAVREREEEYYGIRKGVYVRLTLRRGDTVLMEARGLWGGNSKADEIAGTRQLARELVGAVLQKLNSPASRNVSVTEAKKD